MQLKMNTHKGQRSDISDVNVEKCVSISDHKTMETQQVEYNYTNYCNVA